MTIVQLRYFLKTAELLNYSHAADAMLVARQSLKQSIAAMEDEIGQPLFENRNNRLFLTEYGSYLVVAAQDVVTAFDNMLKGIRSLASSSSKLNVGFSVSLFPFMLPDTENILRIFRSKFPAIELNVIQGDNDSIIASVLSGELDIGCVIQMPCERPDCHQVPLCSFPVAIDFEAPHPFGGRREIKLEELAGHSLLGMGSPELTMVPLWKACREKEIHFAFQTVPDSLDAFYKIKYGEALGFDILVPDSPNFDWDKTCVLNGYEWELAFLCSDHSADLSLQKLFCDFMSRQYALRKERQMLELSASPSDR